MFQPKHVSTVIIIHPKVRYKSSTIVLLWSVCSSRTLVGNYPHAHKLFTRKNRVLSRKIDTLLCENRSNKSPADSANFSRRHWYSVLMILANFFVFTRNCCHMTIREFFFFPFCYFSACFTRRGPDLHIYLQKKEKQFLIKKRREKRDDVCLYYLIIIGKGPSCSLGSLKLKTAV